MYGGGGDTVIETGVIGREGCGWTWKIEGSVTQRGPGE